MTLASENGSSCTEVLCFVFNFSLFIYLFGCTGSSLLTEGFLYFGKQRLLVAAASLVLEHGL